MNKAFTREPDDTDLHCPLCGSVGGKVPESALTQYIRPEERYRLGSVVFFCETPTCEAIYFDAVEDFLSENELLQPVYPKDPSAPICACFGMTRSDIDDDLTEGTPRRVRELLAKSKTAEAACSQLAASGRCCVPEVQKYYIRNLNRERGL